VTVELLVTGAVAGVKKDRDALMAGLYPWSINQVRRIIRDFDDAANVALSFWEWLFDYGIELYNPGRSSFMTWAAYCLRNRAVNSLRDSREPMLVVFPLDILPSADNIEANVSGSELYQRLVMAMDDAHLDVCMAMLEGRTAADMSNTFGYSRRRAQQLVAEVRELARPILKT